MRKSMETKAQPSDKISPEKAEQILRDGEANGKPLTEKQRGMFGAAAGRKDLRSEVEGLLDSNGVTGYDSSLTRGGGLKVDTHSSKKAGDGVRVLTSAGYKVNRGGRDGTTLYVDAKSLSKGLGFDVTILHPSPARVIQKAQLSGISAIATPDGEGVTLSGVDEMEIVRFLRQHRMVPESDLDQLTGGEIGGHKTLKKVK